MSTPQYPGYGQDPYGRGQDPYSQPQPGADPYGAPPVPPAQPYGAGDPYGAGIAQPEPLPQDGAWQEQGWQGGAPAQGAPAPAVPAPGPIASNGKRIGALVIDLGIAAVIAVIMIVLGVVFALNGSVGAVLTFSALAYLVPFVWIIVMIVLQGSSQSVGARMMKIRIAKLEDGGRIGFWRALLRHLVFSAAGSIIVGYFSVLFDKTGRGQGWHDLVVGSVVLDVSAADTGAFAPSPASSQQSGEVAYGGAQPFDAPPGDPFRAPFGTPAPQASGPNDPFGQPPAPAQPAGDPFAQPPVDPYAAQASGSPVDPYAAQPPLAPDPSAPVDPFGAGATATPPAQPDPFAQPDPPAQPAPEPGPAGPSMPPAAAEPAIARTGDGPVIDFVPGITQDGPVARPGAEPNAAAPVPAPASGLSDQQALDETVVVRRGRRVPSIELVWDDGTRHPLLGRALFGRNPTAEQGTGTVSVRDETLSLSKTHFEIEVADDGVWLTDRHSTNGVTIVRDGERTQITPGERTALSGGDVLEMGDRVTTLEMSAPEGGAA